MIDIEDMYLKLCEYIELNKFLKLNILKFDDLKNKLSNDNILIDQIDNYAYIEKNSLKKIIDISNIEFFSFSSIEKLKSLEIYKFKKLHDILIKKLLNRKEYIKDYEYVKKLYKKNKGINLFLKDLNLISDDILNKTILCFDIEALESNQSKLTEFGISLFHNDNISTNHYIVKENLHLRNGKRVADNKDNFNFGISKIKPLKESFDITIDFINKVDYVIGQGISNDFKYLRQTNNRIQFKSDLKIIDTYYLSFYFDNGGLGLEKMLKDFKIEYKHLHNGGNDAHYNLLLFLKMIEVFNKDKLKIDVIKNNVLIDEEKYKNEKELFLKKWNIELSFQ